MSRQDSCIQYFEIQSVKVVLFLGDERSFPDLETIVHLISIIDNENQNWLYQYIYPKALRVSSY